MAMIKELLDKSADKRDALLVGNYSTKKYRNLMDNIKSIHENVERERKEVKYNEKQIRAELEERKKHYKIHEKKMLDLMENAKSGYASLFIDYETLQREKDDLQARFVDTKKKHEENINEMENQHRIDRMELQTQVQKIERDLCGTRVERNTLRVSVEQYEKKHKDDKNLFNQRYCYKENLTLELNNKIAVLEQNVLDEKENIVKERKKGKEELKQKELEWAKVWDVVKEREDQIESLKKDLIKKDEEMEEVKEKFKGQDNSSLLLQIKVKNQAYLQIVDDYTKLCEKNTAEMFKIRQQYEDRIKAMNYAMKALHLEKTTKVRELETIIDGFQARIDSVKSQFEIYQNNAEDHNRKQDNRIDTITKERSALQNAVKTLSYQLELKEKKEEKRQEDKKTDSTKDAKKVLRLEHQIRKMVNETADIAAMRDDEIEELMLTIARLQKQIAQNLENQKNIDREWEIRVVEKEKALDSLQGEIYGGERALEAEKAKIAGLIEELKFKDSQHILLDKQFHKAIAGRMHVEKELEDYIVLLEEELKVEIEKQEIIRQDYIKQLEEEKESKQKMKEEFEADIEELKQIIDKQKIDIKSAVEKVMKLSQQVEEIQRDMDEKIKQKDQAFNALKSEMQFQLQLAEEKFQKLQKAYEKLKNKYMNEIGQGGVKELQERVVTLKEQIKGLEVYIEQQKARIAALDREVLELKLENEEIQNETAHLLKMKEIAYKKQCDEVKQIEEAMEALEEKTKQRIKEVDEEKKELRKSCRFEIKKMEEEIKRLSVSDRDDLIRQIRHWKSVVEDNRGQHIEEIEDLQKLMDQGDFAAEALKKENCILFETNERIERERKEEKEEEAARYKFDIGKRDVRIHDLQTDLGAKINKIEEIRRQHEAEMEDASAEAPWVQLLRNKIATLDLELKAARIGNKEMAKEYKEMEESVNEQKQLLIDNTTVYERKIEKTNYNYAQMDIEYADMRKMMKEELLCAELKISDMEKSMRNMPNPYATQLAEYKNFYSATLEALSASQGENAGLCEQMEGIRADCKKQIHDMQDNVLIIGAVLSQVETLKELESINVPGRLLCQNAWNDPLDSPPSRKIHQDTIKLADALEKIEELKRLREEEAAKITVRQSNAEKKNRKEEKKPLLKLPSGNVVELEDSLLSQYLELKPPLPAQNLIDGGPAISDNQPASKMGDTVHPEKSQPTIPEQTNETSLPEPTKPQTPDKGSATQKQDTPVPEVSKPPTPEKGTEDK